jgi:hypothetical protein
MTPQERQWLETLLEVRAPWQVQGFKWSDGTRQLSVQVGTAAESAGPFWAPRKLGGRPAPALGPSADGRAPLRGGADPARGPAPA